MGETKMRSYLANESELANGFRYFRGTVLHFRKIDKSFTAPTYRGVRRKKNYTSRGHRGTGIYNEEMGWGSFVRALELQVVLSPLSYCIVIYIQ